MDRLIEKQIFALDMDVLRNRMQCLQIEDKVITLLNELWDQMCINTTARCTVEITCEEDGMEFTVGELMVPKFYFMNENEKKFMCQLQYILKSQVLWEDWFKTIIYQQFVTDWMNEPFTPWYWKIKSGLTKAIKTQ